MKVAAADQLDLRASLIRARRSDWLTSQSHDSIGQSIAIETRANTNI